MKKFSFKKVLSLILIAAMIMVIAGGCSKNDTAADANAKAFTVTVVDKEGNTSEFSYTSDKKYVGEALLEEGLIEGTESSYGLYVTKVNGIEAIYENDGTYWAFYINGEYAMTGVDSTPIEDGANYKFAIEG